MKSYELSNSNTVTLNDGGRKIELAIKNIIKIDYVTAVRFEPPIGVIINENILGFNQDSQFIWQVEEIKHVYEDSPYIDLLITNGNLIASNWDGDEISINIIDGSIFSKIYKK